jgi:hypothetical protein
MIGVISCYKHFTPLGFDCAESDSFEYILKRGNTVGVTCI